MVERNINLCDRKKEIITKTWILQERKSSHYEFLMKKTFKLWISGSKRGSFSTQEVGRKIFP